jgi:hypothetical protein
MVAYGDCNRGREANQTRYAGERMMDGPHWSGAVRSTGQHIRRQSGPRRCQTMMAGAPMRRLWHRAGQAGLS